MGALLLALVMAAAPQLQMTLSERLDVKQATFLWSWQGDATNVAGWTVNCGREPFNYTIFSPLLKIDDTNFPVREMARENGRYWCVVSAVEGDKIVADSNQVVFDRQGRWVYRYVNGE